MSGMIAGSGPWIAGLVILVAAADLWWGRRVCWLLGLATVAVAAALTFAGLRWTWFVGIGIAMPFSVWAIALNRRELEGRALELRHRIALLEQKLDGLGRSVEEQQRVIKGGEASIQAISDLYDLSKKFLGTLEVEQALRITEEAIAKGLLHMDRPQQEAYLAKVKALVEQGEISMESLVTALPAGRIDLSSWEEGGIVLGQLALGLKRISLYRQVQESTIHDGLTGLLVRRHFLERLREEIGRAARHGTSLVFLMVDLDHFKEINDRYGHLVGDVVLREAAHLIQRSIREVDLVGRYGGEEFGVVLPEADRALGVQIADRIREALSRSPIPAYDERVIATVSVGVALYPEDASSVEALIEQAERAMYQAKAGGRNRTVSVI